METSNEPANPKDQLIVGLLELQEAQYDAWSSRMTKLFEELDIDIEVVNLSRDKGDIIGKRSIIRNHPVDVVVSDVCLEESAGNQLNMGGDGREGLNKLNVIKEAYPEIFTIAITSAENLSAREVAAIAPRLDMFIDKPNFKRMREQILTTLKDKVRVNPRVKVHFDPEIDAPGSRHKIQVSPTMLTRVVRRLFGGRFGKREFSGEIDKVEIRRIHRGFSKSSVFEMRAYSGIAPWSISILKFSESAQSEVEVDNFKRFVEWHLPAGNRPYIRGVVALGEISCICYSFVFDEADSVESFDQLVKTGETERACQIVQRLFSSEGPRWHRKFDGINVNLTENYEAKVFVHNYLERCSERFRGMFRQFRRYPGEGFLFGDMSVPSPRRYLMGVQRDGLRACICHGDLHSGNIFVQGEQYGFIDFESTGIGHIYEDFTALEASLRLELPGISTEAEMLEGIEAEKKLWSEGQAPGSIEKIISEIRECAKNVFEWNEHEYLISLAYRCFGLFRIPRIPDDKLRRIGCTLAFCLWRAQQTTDRGSA